MVERERGGSREGGREGGRGEEEGGNKAVWRSRTLRGPGRIPPCGICFAGSGVGAN